MRKTRGGKPWRAAILSGRALENPPPTENFKTTDIIGLVDAHRVGAVTFSLESTLRREEKFVRERARRRVGYARRERALPRTCGITTDDTTRRYDRRYY